MNIKYNCEIAETAILGSLRRLTNQIYKLLPMREESSDWGRPLQTIIEEVAGMDRLLSDQHDILFPLLCKLEGLVTLTAASSFDLYRATIFECLGLISELRDVIQS